MIILIPVLMSTLLGVIGQLILKYGMQQMGAQSLQGSTVVGTIVRMATSPYVVGGLLIYCVGVFFWLIALSRVSLSFAYPFASLSYVLIVIASWLLYNERISPMRIAGVVVICLGVLLVARSYSEEQPAASSAPSAVQAVQK